MSTDVNPSLEDNPEDLLGASLAETPPDETLDRDALVRFDADVVDATMSAIGYATTGGLTTSASAVGVANVAGDVDARLSVLGIAAADGDATIKQSYLSGFLAGGTATVTQGAVATIWAREARVKQGAAGVVVASEAKVKKGFAGVVIGKDVYVSDDSRVLIGTKAALIIAAALLGGFGLLAIVAVVLAKRAVESQRRAVGAMRHRLSDAAVHGTDSLSVGLAALRERLARS